MRKTLIIFLAVAGVCFAQEQKFPFIGIVEAESVNLRAGANLNFEIITKLNKSDKVFVVSESYNWYKIRLPQTADCYVNKKYIKIYRGQTGVVLANRLNVRARPKETSGLLGQVKKGQTLKILGKVSGDWYKIIPPQDSYGWVDSSFVKYFPEYTPESP